MSDDDDDDKPLWRTLNTLKTDCVLNTDCILNNNGTLDTDSKLNRSVHSLADDFGLRAEHRYQCNVDLWCKKRKLTPFDYLWIDFQTVLTTESVVPLCILLQDTIEN